MDYKEIFKMPKPMKITGRSSSITNSFINSIIPVIQPNEEEIKQALELLKIDPSNMECIYCGSSSTEWDHLRPIVKNKRPTGYVSEICNLVPSCGKCNQSKGNKYWKTWMLSDAKLSPSSKKIDDLNERIERLELYEMSGNPIKVDFEKFIDAESWQKHWANCNEIQSLMIESQKLAEVINNKIKKLFT